MNFLEALGLAVKVIREQDEIDEIYLYEPKSKSQVYLKDCEGSLQFIMVDEILQEQVFLAGILNEKLQKKQLSIATILGASWEVRLRKLEHLRAKIGKIGKTKETFIDYAPIGKEEV